MAAAHGMAAEGRREASPSRAALSIRLGLSVRIVPEDAVASPIHPFAPEPRPASCAARGTLPAAHRRVAETHPNIDLPRPLAEKWGAAFHQRPIRPQALAAAGA